MGLYLAGFGLVLSSAALAQSTDLSRKAPQAGAALATARSQGYVRVIVQYEPQAAGNIAADAGALAALKTRNAAVQDAIIGAHFGGAGTAQDGRAVAFPRGISRFDVTPGFAVNVSAAELTALAADPRVRQISIDRLSRPNLLQTVPLIGATTAFAHGSTGSGWAVAVLDTGVQANHEFLVGKVVDEACFSTGGGGAGVSLCPNGQSSQTGAGSADPNTAQCLNAIFSLCTHGTHVAGIAAGLNTAQSAGEPESGIGRDAKILAIQVFTRFNDAISCAGQPPCIGSFDSDQVRALDYVFQHINVAPGVQVASVNMSLGSNDRTASACDADVQKAPIDNLRSVGVLTVIATGNDGDKNGIAHPACISSAVSVASTTKGDAVSSFSNMAPNVTLLAPGGANDGGGCSLGANNSDILSSIPGLFGSTTAYACMAGTSMAAPHVAGVIALARSACPSAPVDALLNVLRTTGVMITDTRAGASGNIVKPRIRADYTTLPGCGSIPTTTPIVASVLPNARTTTTGNLSSAFATIVNAGQIIPAQQCSLAPPAGFGGSFLYHTTDAVTNALTGSANTPINIPVGSAQSFYFAVTPAQAGVQDMQLVFSCANAPPAPSISGLSTFLLATADSPFPDLLSISQTPSQDGNLVVPGPNGTGVMVAAAIDIGVGGAVTFVATDTPFGQPPRNMPVTLTICQTDSSAQCLAPAADSITLNVAAGQTLTFSVFAQGQGVPVAYNPASNRVFLVAQQGATPVGATSVALKME